MLALGAACAWPLWACAPRAPRPNAAVPEGPITLGWRWLPGATWTWRCTISRENDGHTSSRAEEWTYVVRDVDPDGIAMLEGRLVGFGAGASGPAGPVPEAALADSRALERERADRTVVLRIGMDGRLAAIDAGDFADALPHQMLALRVPAGAVDPHDEWPLPGLIRLFAPLLPTSLEVQSRATARLLEVHRYEDTVAAEIETAGWLRSPGGPAVHLSGTATWDTVRGALARRELLARFTPSTPDPARNPGSLRVTITRIG